ncbi:putative N-ethylmaleimide reductase [Hyaloscypha variabilis F]|uniref:Putative N-ethylmaleimide reductase n=1 Tax=Hyaloscypha variabilis (strain UAMH 11265 / GT02V1 / F) TaxID=1149755 RepID=A0A2J6S514_HYAVF|nr:putative N-ethylmaleimide reductase [Hyaloscypha variabilis F]
MAGHHSANKSCSRSGHIEPNSTQFHFVSTQNPNDAQDLTTRRQARSHAVARGIENKRKLQQKTGHNFRFKRFKEDLRARRRCQNPALVASPWLLTGAPDLFQTLAAEAPSLRALQIRRKAREPVFSVSDELVLRNFRLVLRKGFDDHALLSAIMLTFAFASTAGGIDRTCLEYQSAALRSIRQRIGSLERATSESTLGAILLLAGIEARLGMPRQVQLHMGAIQELLNLCRKKGVSLSEGIKRAIFWQDLNSSVMTGSSRVVSHTTFSELKWRRDTLSPNFFILPPGFQAQAHLLGEEFVDVLKDVYALQCIRDHSPYFGPQDVISMARIDNHQASIQSRLVSLQKRSAISECCHLAAYLCSAMLRCKLWRESTIPSHLSLQLLNKLQQANNDPVWDDRPELLTWLLYIGGAFAPTGRIRSDYVVLLDVNRSSRLAGLYTSWPELLEILKQFIWSEGAFMAQVKAFWGEICRIALAPLTRLRATASRVPTPLMATYYSQRAAVPGTLLLTEGTFISSTCGGFANAPGLWLEEQVSAWKPITDAVHAKGCFIFCQLFAMGRAASVEVATAEGVDVVAPSTIPIDDSTAVPRAMSLEEIQQTVRDFVSASKNAIRAGFDGVEVHGANGYLLDQFLQDNSNKRTDKYGGSVENRSRLLDEVIRAVVEAIGVERVGLRLSPWSTFQGMRMRDPVPQFTDVILKAKRAGIAYLHLIESRISGSDDYDSHDRLDFAIELWDGPLLIAGGYTPEEARRLVDEKYPNKEIVVIFGRYFLANPDLVFRIKEGVALTPYDRKTFYIAESPVGYTDYPFSKEFLACGVKV